MKRSGDIERDEKRSGDIERDKPPPKRSRTSPSVASWSFINNNQSDDGDKSSGEDVDSEDVGWNNQTRVEPIKY